MLRRSLVFLLLTAITSFALRDVGILIWFKVNQAYIARTHCVKRDVKENTCSGKCYLKSKLKEAEDTRDQQPLYPVNTEIQVLYDVNDIYGILVLSPMIISRKLHSLFDDPKVLSAEIGGTYHPPEALLVGS